MVTAPGSGAEIIPFLKTWVNLPMAIGFTVLYAKVQEAPHNVHKLQPAVESLQHGCKRLHGAHAGGVRSWRTCCRRSSCSTRASSPSSSSSAPSPSSCTPCGTCCTPQVPPHSPHTAALVSSPYPMLLTDMQCRLGFPEIAWVQSGVRPVLHSMRRILVPILWLRI